MSKFSTAQISVLHLLSVALWISGFGLVIASWFSVPGLAELGVLFGCLAACLTVRFYLERLLQGERSAFEIGCDAGRAQGCAEVHPVRSVH